MRHRHVAALVTVLFLVTACTDVVTGAASPGGPASRAPSSASGGSDPTEPDPGTSAPSDERPPDDPSFPTDTDADGGPAQPGSDAAQEPMRVEGVRFTTENGYVRLVVTLSGSGVPEWTVGYSEPTTPVGGPADIAGEAFLRLQLRTRTAPDGSSTTNISTSPGPIAQVKTTGFFEGTEEVLIGVRGGERPFRAFALTDPGRIVIDVPSSG